MANELIIVNGSGRNDKDANLCEMIFVENENVEKTKQISRKNDVEDFLCDEKEFNA